MSEAEPQPELTEEIVAAKWKEIATLTDVMVHRIQRVDDFIVHPGSQLAADDVDSSPYQVSHCARACLSAGVDHLHAMKILVIDAQILHGAADYSLIRGALENLATAFWVLHPQEKTIRIERALRWMVKNFKDQDKATRELGLPDYTPAKVKVGKVIAVAERAGCDRTEVSQGYFSTKVLEYADQHASLKPYLEWQVCSGFAHGRPWANLGMNEREIQPSSIEGVFNVRLTSDHTRLLVVALPAVHLMSDVVRLFTDRAAGAPN